MKALLVGVATVTALAMGPAGAADMPLKAPGAPIYASWTGIYIGGSAGVAVGNMRDNCSVLSGFCAGDADDASWVGGGHVGVQWQSGQFVFGVEGKWIATDLNPFSNCPNPAFRCGMHIDNYWTAGGRLGYALFPSSLFYVTGGYAQAKIDNDAVFKATNTVVETFSATHPGWYIGSGAEFRLANTGWVLGAEYNHIDFRSKSATAPQDHEVVRIKATVDTFQARLSYLFNWR